MISVQQIKQLIINNVTSLELLSVLLATENEVRINDLCAFVNVKRRTIELMVKSKPDLLKRKTKYELPNGNPGAPQSKMIVRTEKATQILRGILG